MGVGSMPLIPALGSKRQGQPDLHSVFQARQHYKVRPLSEKNKSIKALFISNKKNFKMVMVPFITN